MEKEFVTYKIALKLKELGFDEEVCALYRHERLYPILGFEKINSIKQSVIAAPLWQQVIDWFSEKYKVYIEIRFCDKDLTLYEFCVYKIFAELVENILNNISLGDDRKHYLTSYEAREQAILKALELCQKERS